jgi:hypothetical protein
MSQTHNMENDQPFSSTLVDKNMLMFRKYHTDDFFSSISIIHGVIKKSLMRETRKPLTNILDIQTKKNKHANEMAA